MSTLPKGFISDFSCPDKPCIGVFGPEYSGKTHFCATAGEWAQSRGTLPGWLICDRKTRRTIRTCCEELGLPVPAFNAEEFLPQKDALKLATNEDPTEVQKAYTVAVKSFLEGAAALGAMKDIDPIIVDSGSQLWDWIAFSHFGRKQDVGKGRVWGPPKQDWTDLMDALQHKTVLITFKSKDEYKDDKRTNRLIVDGPPHVGYTVTSLVRTIKRKVKGDDTYCLDVYQSQDNNGLEGMDELLTGSDITFSNLMAQLRPEEV